MKGLLRNNYYSMQESIKMSVIIALFVGVLTVWNKEAFWTMAISLTIFVFPVNIGTSLQTDESSKWNKFEITLPVSRKTIIQCKYLSYLVMVGIGLLFSCVTALVYLPFGRVVTVQELAFPCFYGLSLAMFTGAFLYPLLLTLGAAKSDLILIISAMASLVAMAGVWLTVGQFIPGAGIRDLSVGVAVTAASAVCFGASYFLSVAIHRRKEF